MKFDNTILCESSFFDLRPFMRSYTQLTREQRYQISALLKMGHNHTKIAGLLMEMRSCAGVVDSVNIQPKTWNAKAELLVKINPQKDL